MSGQGGSMIHKDIPNLTKAIKRMMKTYNIFTGPIDSDITLEYTRAWDVFCRKVAGAKHTTYPDINIQPEIFRRYLEKAYYNELEIERKKNQSWN